MEYCLNLINNHGMLATGIDKQIEISISARFLPICNISHTIRPLFTMSGTAEEFSELYAYLTLSFFMLFLCCHNNLLS